MLANESWTEQLFNALLAQSGWEWLAASLGIAYVILAAKESVWCWPAAFISTLIYTVLFWEGQLPMQALLNAYYIGVAVYGYWVWTKTHAIQNQEKSLTVSRRPLNFHLIFISAGISISLALGYALSLSPDNRLPYLDASVTVFAVMNTLLMAHKVLENWLYWLVINTAAIALYWQTGFFVTIAMFVVYWVLAVYGYWQWRQTYLLPKAS
ncbi:nicotinamide riboside transporter PnuC [Thiosulfativibrio zosterae]|uniref:Nicotinamide riboside transporter PnuC n=1 Tax=Thiosulfativibrio zosterae TaxID=2675053 RepID=A0A6F8PLL5_9GAMM|nr:nicotinamide riboside transporter PnuC [Thiosulfativibrio zosterae]BBP42992.1 nicotinamide mononucleotide transporter [Thiosulfativibrio zosterae]